MDLKGCLLLDKPSGLSSFETIDMLRKITGIRKAGHVGTLDPLATGLLLACLGKATKLAQFLMGWDKEYIACIKLGTITDTWDREGAVLESTPAPELTQTEITERIAELTGEVSLLAPDYSALKFEGKRLYQFARAGKAVPRQTKKVRIYSAEALEFTSPFVTVKIFCSKGTYIRSFAYHLGQNLGCGATIWELRRTKLGPYQVEEALSLEQLRDLAKENEWEEHLITLANVLGHLPRVVIGEEGHQKVRHGVVFKPTDVLEFDHFQKDRWVRILDPEEQLLAVGRSLCDSANLLTSPEATLFKYERVLVN